VLSGFGLYNVSTKQLPNEDPNRANLLNRCFGAASAKDRLDVVVRDAINAGDVPGPRYLANAREIAKPEGDLVPGITAFAEGAEGS
jgi:hypothetical protein